jgi:hypothetical protein
MAHLISMILLQIFALNARLAAAESMTHDVIRDLLGVKLDMTNYVVNLCVPTLLFCLIMVVGNSDL